MKFLKLSNMSGPLIINLREIKLILSHEDKLGATIHFKSGPVIYVTQSVEEITKYLKEDQNATLC
jgi:hypothetical protein